MNALRWKQMQEIFHEAVALPPDDVAPYLAAVCCADPEMLADVQRLVDQDKRSDWVGALAAVAVKSNAETQEGEPTGGNSLPPDELTQYQFVRYLGQGGMGTVYQAKHRTTNQIVAIKVLLAGTLSVASRERFATEQRALARLNHPHIARLYGSDKFRDGTPCFIMEYVEGEPLTQYCEAHELDVRERVILFRQVCEAVRHAHENAIIHRDLKPSNILVRNDGMVRLLDFGIAKQLDLEDATAVTGNQRAPLTFKYAAPEQVTAGRIGTHTDVYALGVTLYELLTRHSPIELQGLTPGQIEAAIQFQTPERPSRLILSEKGNPIKGTARLGKWEWSDVDVLCATAMHKDPERRYRSVEALMRDLDNWLYGQALEAQPDSWRYRLTKFVKRQQRALLTAAALILIAASTLTWFTLRLAKARDEALNEQARTERVKRFVLNLFDTGDATAPSRTASAANMLERGRKEAESLKNEPSFQAELFDVLGGLYGNLGEFAQADRLFHMALSLQGGSSLAKERERAESLLGLATMRADESKFGEAEKFALAGLALKQEAKASQLEIAQAENAVGRVYGISGHFRQARPHLEHAFQIETQAGEMPSEKAFTTMLLAENSYQSGKYPEALRLGYEALALDRKLYSANHPRVSLDTSVIAGTYMLEGRYAEAEKNYLAALDMDRQWYGNDHMKTIQDEIILGRTLISEKKYDEARAVLTEGLRKDRKLFDNTDQLAVYALDALAILEQQSNHLDAAENFSLQALKAARELYGRGTEGEAVEMSNLGNLYCRMGNYAQAIALLKHASTIAHNIYPQEHPNLGRISYNLGKAFFGERHYVEARQELEVALAIFQKEPNPPKIDIDKAKAMLAAIKRIQGT